MTQPNILFLMTDQQRWDAMSGAANGRAWVNTPNLDRIAAEGMRFSRCVTTTPICIPARVTLATGRYPHNTSVWNNVEYTLPTGVAELDAHAARASATARACSARPTSIPTEATCASANTCCTPTASTT